VTPELLEPSPKSHENVALTTVVDEALKKTVSLTPGVDGENVKLTAPPGRVPDTVMVLELVAVCPTPLLTLSVTV
jgi:hypothetical protein